MNYSQYLDDLKKKQEVTISEKISGIDGYKLLKQEMETRLSELPENVERDTVYGRKYNLYLSSERSRATEEISYYTLIIEQNENELSLLKEDYEEILKEIDEVNEAL